MVTDVFMDMILTVRSREGSSNYGSKANGGSLYAKQTQRQMQVIYIFYFTAMLKMELNLLFVTAIFVLENRSILKNSRVLDIAHFINLWGLLPLWGWFQPVNLYCIGY